jgi:hypothetical protein
MIRTRTLRAAHAKKNGRRTRRIFAGALALAATLLPIGASAMDSTPKPAVDRTGNLLPLPPIPYLDSMRWMSWKPAAPLFKIDTLLLPDRAQPGFLVLPSEYERSLPRMS